MKNADRTIFSIQWSSLPGILYPARMNSTARKNLLSWDTLVDFVNLNTLAAAVCAKAEVVLSNIKLFRLLERYFLDNFALS
jgi:hypothetical protein